MEFLDEQLEKFSPATELQKPLLLSKVAAAAYVAQSV